MRIINIFLGLFLPTVIYAQQGFTGSLSAMGFAKASGTNSFWLYTDRNGRIDKNTDYLGLGTLEYEYSLQDYGDLHAGLGLLINNAEEDDLRLDELFINYSYKNLQVSLGTEHRDIKLLGLSSVGGDILFSGNARALPGILVALKKPVRIFKGLGLKASLGHYLLNDVRYVKNTQVHFKDIQLIINTGPHDLFSLKLSHYAQYGGTSPDYGQQPDGFKDYIKIFFGNNGDKSALESDQENALGNHIGSYEFLYNTESESYSLTLYHQSIFEDTSGRELSNFPDGVWGAFWQPKKKSIITALLYEYVQTVSQSGRFGSWPNGTYSGGDNYFYNGIYRSGWTYENNIIGLPFIIPDEDGLSARINRFYVHHIGVAGEISKIRFSFKESYVRNLGTFGKPITPPENAFYSFLGLSYPVSNGSLDFMLGADFSDAKEHQLSAGLGYSIYF